MRIPIHAFLAFILMYVSYMVFSGFIFEGLDYFLHAGLYSDFIGNFLYFFIFLFVFLYLYRGILPVKLPLILMMVFGVAINTYILFLDMRKGGGNYYYYPVRIFACILSNILCFYVFQRNFNEKR
jgi:hypothetical protein